jgi:hypothetical protein
MYVICLVAAGFALNACSKNNDATPASPVVGRWELNRGLLSSYPTSASLNGSSLDLYYVESVGSTIDVFSDNTFNENYRNIFVDDGSGTWTFSNNTLTLKYDAGDQQTYTYAKNKNIEELSATQLIPYSVPVSSTASVSGQIQLVYRK